MLAPDRAWVIASLPISHCLITPCCLQDRSGKGPQQVSATTVQREALSLYVPLPTSQDAVMHSSVFS